MINLFNLLLISRSFSSLEWPYVQDHPRRSRRRRVVISSTLYDRQWAGTGIHHQVNVSAIYPTYIDGLEQHPHSWHLLCCQCMVTCLCFPQFKITIIRYSQRKQPVGWSLFLNSSVVVAGVWFRTAAGNHFLSLFDRMWWRKVSLTSRSHGSRITFQ